MLNRYRAAILTAIGLVIMGAGGVYLRLKYVQKQDGSQGNNVWRLTYNIGFPVIKEGKIYIALPDNTAQCRVVRESFSHKGIWMDVLRSKRTLGREAVIVPIVGYNQGRFIADFEISLKQDVKSKLPPVKVKLTPEEMAYYLREEEAVQINSLELFNIISPLKEGKITRGKMLERIFDFCSENIVRGGGNTPTDALGTLQQGMGTALGRARAMVALCRTERIPARLTTGFFLKTNSDARPHYWVEVFYKNNWLSYDPENGYAGKLPMAVLPVRRDGVDIVRTPARDVFQAIYSIRHLLPAPTFVFLPDNRFWSVFDLTRLPLNMQEIIALLLLLPLGALITAIFRNVIGIRTFGTFTPALIALCFVQADLRTGALVFFVVLTVGILARLLLNQLKLLLVARLGIILTLVVLCMILAVSILDYMNLTPSASAVLLPTVILTMMIERFNITAEEDGLPQAFKVFAGTLGVAICCLLVLGLEGLGRLVLMFPEIQLFNAAALLLIGRYSGYRLTELWRFRDIAQS
ncbi:MAG TPA: 7TM domain-containing protein [Sedimentisphaerales bacterium]|nr:7TM domain-containing protein [Sedimentisphaerales bacterium]